MAFVVALTASAKFEIPEFYSEDFAAMAAEHDYPTDGWITYGNGATPSEGYPAQFFGDLNGSSYMLLNAGLNAFAMANTIFDGNVAADEWLITPEIEVPYDNAVVSFTAAGYSAVGRMPSGFGRFTVLASPTGGTAKEDFTQVVLKEGTINTSGNESLEIPTKNIVASMNDLKGKKVRLAFVVNNQDQVGFVGFTDIKIGQYAIKLEQNLTESLASVGSEYSVSANFSLYAPMTCPGVKATLKVNGEDAGEKYYEKAIGNQNSTKMQIQLVEFLKIGVVENTNPINWELYITPDFEGAIPSMLNGTIGVAEYTYPQNVVVEEITATGCQACPSGIAALEYYGDTYKGGDGKGRFIGIAIHGYINHVDPMSSGVETYLNKLQGFIGTTSYPSGAFNRDANGIDPANKSDFERVYAKTTYNEATITKVEIPDNSNAEEMHGETVNVHFSVKNGYTTINRPLDAAVVMIENNVEGNEKNYNQTNGFAKQSESYVVSAYGAFLVPYISKFLPGGELGQGEISFRDIKYQHVARGIWPGFFGESIAESWTSGVAQDFNMEVKVPETVMKFDETEVIVLIMDGETHSIVASDIMPASEFVKVSGVETVAADSDVVIAKNGDSLYVKSNGKSVADVYTIDGRHVASYSFEGELLEAAPATGVLVVKVAGEAAAKTAKLVF